MKNRLIQQEKVVKKNHLMTDLPPMPLLEGDKEEVKEGKELKLLTPNKLLTRLPILFAQKKPETIHVNLKMKSDKYYISCISIIKSIKKVYKSLIKSHYNGRKYNTGRKYDCDRRSYNVWF